jgi:hypothetical protein
MEMMKMHEPSVIKVRVQIGEYVPTADHEDMEFKVNGQRMVVLSTSLKVAKDMMGDVQYQTGKAFDSIMRELEAKDG